jgi:hypothetical protein
MQYVVFFKYQTSEKDRSKQEVPMCTQVIVDDLLTPHLGEIPTAFVTGYSYTGGNLTIMSESEMGKDSAVFSMEEDIAGIETSCYPGDIRLMLEVITHEGESYMVVIEREMAQHLMHKLANMKRPNGVYVRNASLGS